MGTAACGPCAHCDQWFFLPRVDLQLDSLSRYTAPFKFSNVNNKNMTESTRFKTVAQHVSGLTIDIPANTKHLYNICTASAAMS